ncbi:hypothetical protein [Candidatus Protochlamydia amoebophila]|uniref:Uncharacterized protein n=1 Tax=Candidatus Protochlamydia amoebophila TaxID=362787 RepID=A0A0C1H847_9BACT|nr:hypothetical protein [Candidatus Protochlamydia amoebophila]KIC71063.1 hypothetical protein DB44_EU00020 [Candidatus Protochlamydia amoebophila]
MNSINLGNSDIYYPKILPQELLEFVDFNENPQHVIVKVSQKDRLLLKITSVIQAIFKTLFQVFECISHYACLLANGLISIKAKLLGVDLHLHFQLFNVIINYESSNKQNISPSSILTC